MADEVKVGRELAEQDVLAWGKANDIDFDTEGLDRNVKALFDMTKDRMVKCVMDGRLVFDGVIARYKVSENSPVAQGFEVTIKPPTGAAYMGLDSYGIDQAYHKYTALLSAMTGQPVAWFSGLANFDHKVLIGFAQLFMNV